MKKLFLILAVSALFLIVGCGDGSKKVDNADSGETVTDEDGDTADEEPADDSEPADTEPAEDSDKDGGDSADDSGDSGDSKPDEDPTPEPTEADQCVAAGGTWSWDGTEGSCAKTVSCKKSLPSTLNGTEKNSTFRNMPMANGVLKFPRNTTRNKGTVTSNAL